MWKIESLSLCFFRKDLAQGGEPNKRVFPSWSQVRWQNRRLTQAAALLLFVSPTNACWQPLGPLHAQSLWLLCWPWPSLAMVSITTVTLSTPDPSAQLPFRSSHDNPCSQLLCARPRSSAVLQRSQSQSPGCLPLPHQAWGPLLQSLAFKALQFEFWDQNYLLASAVLVWGLFGIFTTFILFLLFFFLLITEGSIQKAIFKL